MKMMINKWGILYTVIYVCGCVKIDDVIQKEQAEMRETFAELRARIASQDQVIAQQQRRITTLEQSQAVPAASSLPNLRMAYGCTADTISLACDGEATILVTHADYGNRSIGCYEGGCCIPNPLDCVETVSTNNAADWLALKVTCDNNTSCDYLFPGAIFLDVCGQFETVDYMSIYYSCLPDAEPGTPVGFSAHAGQDRSYNANELMQFELSSANLAGSYQAHTSTFLCPVSGVYVFGINLLTLPVDAIYGRVMRNGEEVAGFQSDVVVGVRSPASTLVLITCHVGDKVWVKDVGTNRTLQGGPCRYSMLTGFLLREHVM